SSHCLSAAVKVLAQWRDGRGRQSWHRLPPWRTVTDNRERVPDVSERLRTANHHIPPTAIRPRCGSQQSGVVRNRCATGFSYLGGLLRTKQLGAQMAL
ncbi:MAG: hypothetical protein J2P17_28900, partial [Mycobacterium sp.]|nr:hypothetical protein [Mycobacterium sp.]